MQVYLQSTKCSFVPKVPFRCQYKPMVQESSYLQSTNCFTEGVLPENIPFTIEPKQSHRTVNSNTRRGPGLSFELPLRVGTTPGVSEKPRTNEGN